MAKYQSLVKSNNPKAYTGGYKNVVMFAPRADFLVLQKPTSAGEVIGDTLSIATSHTFTPPKGFFSLECKQHTVTGTAATVGDDGSGELEWTYVYTILGDSASTQEMMQQMINDDLIALYKDANCQDNDSYVQLGDECSSPVNKVAFDGKTTKEGMKEYTVTSVCKAKYFYTGTVTMATAEEEEG